MPSSPIDSLSAPKSQGSRILEVHPEEFLPSPRPLMIVGGWAALLTLAGVFAGACFLPYTAKVKATAVVRALEGASEQRFVLQAWIPNASINKVQPEQQVQVRLAACPYPDYGVLRGSVEVVALDAIPQVIPPASGQTMNQILDSATAQVPAGSYEILIQPEANQLEAQGKRCELRAGMVGRADILVGEEKLARFLLRKLRLMANP